MGIYISLFMIIFNGAWLWFCFVYFTKDYSHGWKEFILWGAVARLLAMPFMLLKLYMDTALMVWTARIAGNLLAYVFLYIILSTRFALDSPKLKFKILLAHFSLMLIISLALMAIR